MCTFCEFQRLQTRKPRKSNVIFHFYFYSLCFCQATPNYSRKDSVIFPGVALYTCACRFTSTEVYTKKTKRAGWWCLHVVYSAWCHPSKGGDLLTDIDIHSFKNDFYYRQFTKGLYLTIGCHLHTTFGSCVNYSHVLDTFLGNLYWVCHKCSCCSANNLRSNKFLPYLSDDFWKVEETAALYLTLTNRIISQWGGNTGTFGWRWPCALGMG